MMIRSLQFMENHLKVKSHRWMMNIIEMNNLKTKNLSNNLKTKNLSKKLKTKNLLKKNQQKNEKEAIIVLHGTILNLKKQRMDFLMFANSAKRKTYQSNILMIYQREICSVTFGPNIE